MEVDFSGRDTKISPFLDKAVKRERLRNQAQQIFPQGRASPGLSLQYVVHKTKMARNCEKKLIGLNRLWLAKQKKGLLSVSVLNRFCLIWVLNILFCDDLFSEELENSPKRPHLVSIKIILSSDFE